MRKFHKLFLIIILSIFILGTAGYYFLYHSAERDIKTEKTAYSVTSDSIISQFTSNPSAANAKYLEKPIAITGTITAIKDTLITLDYSIICSMQKLNPTLTTNQQITIKGRVVGYDDLLGELKLDKCIITNTN